MITKKKENPPKFRRFFEVFISRVKLYCTFKFRSIALIFQEHDDEVKVERMLLKDANIDKALKLVDQDDWVTLGNDYGLIAAYTPVRRFQRDKNTINELRNRPNISSKERFAFNLDSQLYSQDKSPPKFRRFFEVFISRVKFYCSFKLNDIRICFREKFRGVDNNAK